ncbi:hypothetical protein ILUMI_05308 [Ignelater luminosus]|uniref:Uncharacterized protein n=1 Tax=Ignelater luminosus TaxID=2038154 RepID=A0A8K0DCU6_IGNLU|nr:hypothetical protein ILUMI_05308 [Ignelater luminosus]
MLFLRLKYKSSNNLLKCCRLFATANAEEYTDIPQYPPILNLSLDKVRERRIQAYCEEVKAVKTVEEKQLKLNMPRYYGFKCYMFYENNIPYDNLELVQHITRTHLIKDSLPDYYNNIKVDSVLETIKSDIEEAILLELDGYRKNHEIMNEALSKSQIEDIISSAVGVHVNRALLNNLCKDFPHLVNTTTDIDPRIESSWFAGGMIAPLRVQSWRKAKPWFKDQAKDPVDRAIQYIGMPSLTVRSELPLCPVIPYSEAENSSFDVPVFKFDPGVVGMLTEHRRLVNTPGSLFNMHLLMCL